MRVSQSTDLAERYGAPSRRGRAVMLSLSVIIAAAFLGWLGWTIWEQSTPEVRSDLVGYDVVDPYRVTATVEVRLRGDDVQASCRVRAYAEDHVTVGEQAFTPDEGRNEVDIRTEREATAVELLGCTAPGQSRPR